MTTDRRPAPQADGASDDRAQASERRSQAQGEDRSQAPTGRQPARPHDET